LLIKLLMLGLVNILSILTDKIKSFEMVNIRVGLTTTRSEVNTTATLRIIKIG